ncbi:Vps51/Vps67 [Carpediemonas membranifera]|uniref:Vacuolar protein sorting-associated protein 51 homolog n=1 Tax=Carpediemonas membranifera TaxID=201153 RepID=A0A8J6ATL8_9EUKA|nr:Vps51/Vps67 [Carpediemonas membranifera]|eukprot:KAG9392090.1 Vps51/Vps67 [Carpediemonas membranifera]
MSRIESLLQAYHKPETKLSSQSPKSTNLDSTNFDSERYLAEVFGTQTIGELIQTANGLSTDIVQLDGKLQSLVYENYSKFLAATKTLNLMLDDSVRMQEQVGQLKESITRISQRGTEITEALEPHHARVRMLHAEYRDLKGLEAAFELKERIAQITEDSAASVRRLFSPVEGSRQFRTDLATISFSPLPSIASALPGLRAATADFVGRATQLWNCLRRLRAMELESGQSPSTESIEDALIAQSLDPLHHLTTPQEELVAAVLCGQVVIALQEEGAAPADGVADEEGAGDEDADLDLPADVRARLAAATRRVGDAMLRGAVAAINRSVSTKLMGLLDEDLVTVGPTSLVVGTVGRLVQMLRTLMGTPHAGQGLLEFIKTVTEGEAVQFSEGQVARIPKAFNAATATVGMLMSEAPGVEEALISAAVTPVVVHAIRTVGFHSARAVLTKGQSATAQILLGVVGATVMGRGIVDDTTVGTELEDAAWTVVHRGLSCPVLTPDEVCAFLRGE